MRLFSLIACILLALGSSGKAQEAPPSPPVVVISNVAIIDTAPNAKAVVQKNMTVVVRGGQIESVEPASKASAPKGATVVDGTGKFLLPGLWDMHVHGSEDTDIFQPLFLANGVTGVRNMGGYPQAVYPARDAANADDALAPRMVVAGPIVDGARPIWPFSIPVSTPEEGRAAVKKLKQDRADFVKVYALLGHDSYKAIVAEAKAQGLPVCGHVPYSTSAYEASTLGQRSIEHLDGIGLARSMNEETLRARILDSIVKRGEFGAARVDIQKANREAWDSDDPKKTKALINAFVKNKTWQVPTLTVLKGYGILGDESQTSDVRLKYLPTPMTSWWEMVAANSTPETIAEGRRRLAMYLAFVGDMHRAGVGILAGTDTPNPYCLPGFGIHDELALLVEAGMTPVEALRAATWSPAEFFNATDRFGAVRPGLAADLLMLDANPLDDIHNSTKIASVVVRGRVLDRKALDAMLNGVETKAARPLPRQQKPSGGFLDVAHEHVCDEP